MHKADAAHRDVLALLLKQSGHQARLAAALARVSLTRNTPNNQAAEES